MATLESWLLSSQGNRQRPVLGSEIPLPLPLASTLQKQVSPTRSVQAAQPHQLESVSTGLTASNDSEETTAMKNIVRCGLERVKDSMYTPSPAQALAHTQGLMLCLTVSFPSPPPWTALPGLAGGGSQLLLSQYRWLRKLGVPAGSLAHVAFGGKYAGQFFLPGLAKLDLETLIFSITAQNPVLPTV